MLPGCKRIKNLVYSGQKQTLFAAIVVNVCLDSKVTLLLRYEPEQTTSLKIRNNIHITKNSISKWGMIHSYII